MSRHIIIVIISLSYNKQGRQKGGGENPTLTITTRQVSEKWKEGKEGRHRANGTLKRVDMREYKKTVWMMAREQL